MNAEQLSSDDVGGVRIQATLLSRLGQAYGQMDRLQFVNPLVLDDSVRTALDSARRLLEFERFLDRMEIYKGKQGSLPRNVEARVAQAFVRAQSDAANLARASLDAINELQDVGALEQMVPVVASCLEGMGEIGFDRLFSGEMLVIQKFAEERGLPAELWQWAVERVDFSGVMLSGNKDRVVGRLGEFRSVLVGRNPSHLPTVESVAFVDGQFYRRAVADPNAVLKGVPQKSPYAGMLILAKSLLERYEERARKTALNGVQVLPTGFDPFTIIVIILVVIAVIAGILTVLCLLGVFDEHSATCTISAAVLGTALLVLCVLYGGTTVPVPEEGGAGVLCTFAFDGDEPPVG
jgi:hypothetical protein